MYAQRIILVNGSRLLGDMLHNVICRADHLEMVQEVSRYEELPAAIEHTNAEWVLMSLPFDASFPRWVDDHLAETSGYAVSGDLHWQRQSETQVAGIT
jgi:hypothetical protein